jgi:hypothetical protein
VCVRQELPSPVISKNGNANVSMINSGYTCLAEGAWFYGEICSSAIVALTIISAQAFISNSFVQTSWIAGWYCDGGGDGVNAHGVIILWQSTDFYGISPPTVTASGLVSTVTTTTCISTTPSNTSPSTDSNQGGLSTGDKISIGVGLGLGIPSLLCTVWGVLYARKLYLLKLAQSKIAKGKAREKPATPGPEQWEGLSARVITRTDEQRGLIDEIMEVIGTNNNPTTEANSVPTTKES